LKILFDFILLIYTLVYKNIALLAVAEYSDFSADLGQKYYFEYSWVVASYMSVFKCIWGLDGFVDGLIYNDEKVASSKKNAQFKTQVQKPTLFMTKTAEKPYPLGHHIPI